jgi:hypothetical protein
MPLPVMTPSRTPSRLGLGLGRRLGKPHCSLSDADRDTSGQFPILYVLDVVVKAFFFSLLTCTSVYIVRPELNIVSAMCCNR